MSGLLIQESNNKQSEQEHREVERRERVEGEEEGIQFTYKLAIGVIVMLKKVNFFSTWVVFL